MTTPAPLFPELIAELNAPSAGYKLAPVNPTEEMFEAGRAALANKVVQRASFGVQTNIVWDAMMAKVPDTDAPSRDDLIQAVRDLSPFAQVHGFFGTLTKHADTIKYCMENGK